jgi:glycosyltransferase involved in cell wall biosynthesis
VPKRHDVAIYSPYGSLFYSSGHTGGGAEFQAYTLARELSRAGMSVAHLVYPIADRQPTDEPAPHVVERPPYRGGIPKLGAVVEAVDVWRGFRRANARVYVVRGSGGHVAAAAGFCRAYRRRFVFSSSNDLDYDVTREDRRPAVWRSYRRAVARADHIVAQTGRQLELAREAFPGVPATHIPSFAQPADPAHAHAGAFLWADRIVEYKRPELFLELAEALPDSRFQMITLETDETAWYPELSERVRRRASELANVELVPPLDRREMGERIAGAIAIVKTSEVEGMPNTFLEAWARGVPVLSLSVDPDDRIADNDIGVVAGGSMDRLTAAASRLAAEPALRREMGERARTFIREVHSPAAVAERWRGILEPLVR